MSDPKNESLTDGESDVQASNDGTAGVGEDPQGESSFDADADGDSSAMSDKDNPRSDAADDILTDGNVPEDADLSTDNGKKADSE